MPPTNKRKKNVLLSPIKHEGENIGLLVLSDKGSDFDERDKRLASAFAELISLALMNERYQANLKTLRGELNSTIKERESQVQNLNELFNGMVSAVIVGQRMKIVCANNSAGNILGLIPKELVGTNLSAYKLAGQHATIGNDPIKGEKVELLKADGKTVSVTLTTGRVNWNSKPAIIYLFNE
jgi:GAF domain-containing protein